MKKKLFYLCVFICSMSLFTACSDDGDSWKNIPNGEIVIGDAATIEVNGQALTAGAIQLTSKSASEGALTLKKVLPGYAEVSINVKLEEQSDGSFNFSGKESLTTPPAMIGTKAEAAAPTIFTVSVNGNITEQGKVSAKVASVLSKEAQGGLAGSWNILAKINFDEDFNIQKAPLMMKWSAVDADKPNMEFIANTITALGSPAIFNYLNQVTFHEDGNITAKYWSGTVTIEEIFNGMDENGNLFTIHEDWLNSPKNNLAFWYVKGDYFYIAPNITAILSQVGSDTGGGAPNMGGITEIMAKLGEYGINITTLLPTITQWMSTGIPLKYTNVNGALKIYVDKEMVAPFMTALLPALEPLQVEVDKILNDPNNPNAELIGMLFMILQIEKLSDIKTVWDKNTNEFEVVLNLTK